MYVRFKANATGLDPETLHGLMLRRASIWGRTCRP